MPTNPIAPAQAVENLEPKCKRKWCHHRLEPAERGRPPVYCSESCRQADYRERRKLAQLEQEAEHRHQAVVAVLEHALALELPENSRVSAKKRRETAAAIARHLRLARIIS